MHIVFQNTPQQNINKVTTSYQEACPKQIRKADGKMTDISDTVKDNSAYDVQGRTAEEVMEAAGNRDVALERNYMAVMSDSVSGEDFAGIMRNGEDIMDMDVEEAVTIVDKIKAELIRSGKQITGYTDTLDRETLNRIVGSPALAEALVHSCQAQGVPVNEENLKAGARTVKKAGEIEKISDGMMKYMLENGLEPSVDNLYKARYSGTAEYRMPVHTGQEKTEELTKQIRQVITESGLPETEETLKDAGWLIDREIPLTGKTLKNYEKLKNVSFPLPEEKIAHAAASALAEGKTAGEADITDERSIYERAVDAERKIRALKPSEFGSRRVAEEIRLRMTVEANLKLMKSGYFISTEDLEDFVEKLKLLEEQQAEKLLGDPADVPDYRLYQQVLSEKESIAGMPISVLGKISFRYDAETIHEIHTCGEETAKAYQQAGQAYETFMTVPRADLGDRIRKAFRNTDGILRDLDLSLTEENRRAIRVLGYNSMELNEKNIEEVKRTDRMLQKTVRKMTPAAVLKMIREGINPLERNMEELNRYLDRLEPSYREENEKYSRYLYRLERNHEITGEEKEAYIGIYRLLRQIEKTDGAALGSLLKQGADVEFRNLLSAIRTGKVKGIDVSVDENYGGLEQLVVKGVSISEQINQGFRNDYTGMLSDLTGTAEEIPYAEERAEEYRKVLRTAATEEETVRICREFSLPVTGNRLWAISEMAGNKKSPFFMMNRTGTKWKTRFAKAAGKLEEGLNSPEEARDAYSEFTEEARELTEEYTFSEPVGREDLKALRLMHMQLSVAAARAEKEEYEIPLKTEDGITSLHLVLQHEAETEGTVFVRMRDGKFQSVSARFILNGDRVTGQIHYGPETEGSTEKLEKDFRTCLTEDGFRPEGILLTKLEIGEAGEKQNGNPEVKTDRLYRVAKMFIRAIQMQ